MKKFVKCWNCCGQGWVASFHGHRIDCDRCRTTGECPDDMVEWKRLGDQMKAARREARQSLTVWARARGLDPAKVSQAERGLINPQELKY